MNRTLLFIILLAGYVEAFCITDSEMIVQRFGNSMTQWCSTKNVDYRKAALQNCHTKDGNPKKECMVIDYLMKVEAQKRSLSNKHYVIKNYLNVFQDAFKLGNVSFQMYNIKETSYESIQITNYSSKNASLAKSCTYVACDIDVSGVLNYNLKNLFIISKEGKIWGIETRNEVVDKKTGKKKVSVDFDNLIEHYESIGFTYNYGQHFPVGGSFNYSPEDIPFMISVDLGINLDGDKYIIDKVEMKDIMNYDRTKKTLDPKFFLTVTPQFYLKYFAIGCGVGFLWMDGTEESANYTYSSGSSSGGNASVSISSGGGQFSEGMTSVMLKPMVRPVAKGFIPLRSNELYLSVSVGYDLFFGYKDKNGFNFGLGLQWEL